ncbi:MAG TPA: AarF/UbiB family protein [Myxococcaceae bacterium]|nr:AarF/UbiB family protein [Myxococcaceae bacterium]
MEGEEKPQRRRAPVVVKANFARVAGRTFHWFLNLLRMMGRSLWDRLRGRREPKYFGIRLRKLFEEMGGTAIKVGQQLSVRVDLFPLEVCHELAVLRDKVPPFDFEDAKELIEVALGRNVNKDRVPLEEIFEAFDPSPIGSASIACVYQAVLKNGDRVAVKVRRPNVLTSFGSDLGVVDVVTRLVEALAIVPPQFFKNLRLELRSMLVQELDFNQEARFQRLFRHYAKKDGLKWLTSPKVYVELSSTDVMTSEFVEGYWCDEILKAHEVGDQRALAELRDMGITPKRVGVRLMWYSFWARYEALFFHSDPHPGNILIQRDCKIVFVDFGSCGTTSRKSRLAQFMMLDRMSYNDVSGTVEAAVSTLEPLPFIDIYELKKEVEAHFWDWLFAFRDKKAEWWERTTAGIWFALLEITRKRSIPVGLETLRLARSLLLVDTLCFELDPQMVSPDEFRKYLRTAARRGARRVYKRNLREPVNSMIDNFVWQGDDIVSRGRYMAWQAERIVGDAPNQFAYAISKGMYILSVMLQIGGLVAVAGGLTALYVRYAPPRVGGLTLEDAQQHPWEGTLHGLFKVLQHPASIAVLVVLAWVALRRIWFRLRDLDVD